MADYTGGPDADVYAVSGPNDILPGSRIDGGGGDDTLSIDYYDDNLDLTHVSLISVEQLTQFYFSGGVTLTSGQISGLQNIVVDTLYVGDGGLARPVGYGGINSIYLPSIGGNLDLSGITFDFTFSPPFVEGGEGDDRVRGNFFDDSMHGRGASDTLDGNLGNDVLYGDEGDDTLVGGEGNDRILGGSGRDRMYGGSGTDTFYIDADADAEAGEVYDGGDDYDDTIVIEDGVSADLSGARIRGMEVLGGSGAQVTLRAAQLHQFDRINVPLIRIADGDTVRLEGVEFDPSNNPSVWLSSFGNTVLVGGSNLHIVYGQSGDDAIYGGDAADHLEGGGGSDLLAGGLGDDFLDGGDGIDTVTYAAAREAVSVNLQAFSGSSAADGTDWILGFENVIGSGYNDYLAGDRGDNRLQGSYGADTLAGGDGDDVLDGGTGADVASYADAEGAVMVELSHTGSQQTAAAGIDTLISIEGVVGTGYADILVGSSADNVLQGMYGDDVIRGGAGNDVIDGGDGIDRASYSDATAAVTVDLAITGTQRTFGAGVDTLIGIENLTGSRYGDALAGSDGNNILQGAAGNDTLRGGLGDDTLDGGAGTDRATYSDASAGVTVELYQSRAQNTGVTGTDTLTGIENLTGSSFQDRLFGSDGANWLEGAAGDDTLNGEMGADTLMGGTGRDMFEFTTTLGAGNIDTVGDFSVADDTMSLRHGVFVGLNIGALTTAAFWSGSAAHDADDRIIYNALSGAVLFDRDGNGTTYAAVQFATVGKNLAITSTDFTII